MQLFRELWASLLTWMPSPLRVSLALIAVLFVITSLLPRLIRGLGAVMRIGSVPALALLTYPEFIATTACRRLGWRLLPGTYWYSRGLGALATTGIQVGTWMHSKAKRSLRFPWKTTVAVVVLLSGCWYLAPRLPDGGPKATVNHVNDDLVMVDFWLATGRWMTVSNKTLQCAPAKKRPRTQVGKRRPSSKEESKATSPKP
jgi:hypothetical protein